MDAILAWLRDEPSWNSIILWTTLTALLHAVWATTTTFLTLEGKIRLGVSKKTVWFVETYPILYFVKGPAKEELLYRLYPLAFAIGITSLPFLPAPDMVALTVIGTTAISTSIFFGLAHRRSWWRSLLDQGVLGVVCSTVYLKTSAFSVSPDNILHGFLACALFHTTVNIL